jgi:polyhydroxyalkanoate synthase subunit PhaC
MDLVPTPEQLGTAAANVFDRVMRGGLADLRPLPTAIVDEGPQRTVRRFLRLGDDATQPAGAQDAPPILLVPPLAAPASCFDLRRGCSLAEHLLASGTPPVRRRLRADRLRRPQPRARALGRRGDPARDRGRLG